MHDGASCYGLDLSKTASATSITIGDSITYTYRIVNATSVTQTATFEDDLRSLADYAGSTVDDP